MAFIIRLRDNPGTIETRRALAEEHWAYMDSFEGSMIARGPILDDAGHPAGSLRILDLPDIDAVKGFLDQEPYVAAGIFADISIRQWTNALDRRVSEDLLAPGNQQYVFFGTGHEGKTAERDGLLQAHRDYLNAPGRIEHVILRGPLRDETGETWLGSFFLLDVPGRAAVDALFTDEPYTKAGLYAEREFRRWRMGGTPI